MDKISINEFILAAYEMGRLRVNFTKGILISGLSNKPYQTRDSINGYNMITLKVNGDMRTIFVHRAVWLCKHGMIEDKMEIDHINRKRGDNRIANLRCVTRSINLRNRGKYKRIKRKTTRDDGQQVIAW